MENKKEPAGITRREALKVSGLGLAAGGLALGGVTMGDAAGGADNDYVKQQECPETNACDYPVEYATTQEYTYPVDYGLPEFTLADQQGLDEDEMRITFLGTAFPPSRKAQQMMSIFVEVGPWVPQPNKGFGKATDSFVFDCGVGSLTNYSAMGITPSRMDKVFISHLHADHMSGLTALYCFGPADDRKWPLYVWGQGPSGVISPKPPHRVYDDGVKAFCGNLRRAMRWHSESMSFLPTSSKIYQPPTKKSWGLPCDPVPVEDDNPNDGYGLVPIELDWQTVGGIAYQNKQTCVRISHFPVIHCRKGSMGYKLEWWPNRKDLWNPAKAISMIYTSDTRPETNCLYQAKNGGHGVNVFIHEMILPPELLAMKNMGITWPDYNQSGFAYGVEQAAKIEKSSHTPQGAYGFLLSRITPRPKLAVIAHFPTANDTVTCALESVKAHFSPNGPKDYPVFGTDIVWATDLMVLRVKKDKITQYMAKIGDYTFGPKQNPLLPAQMYLPKYPTATYQLDESTLIEPGPGTYCRNGY